jgi:hypothetical protein
MGNDPVNGIDPDGGFKTPFGAFLWKSFNGGGNIEGNWQDGFTVGQWDENSFEMTIVSGKIDESIYGSSVFDMLGQLIQDKIGVVVWGSGYEFVGFNDRFSGRVISIDLDEFLTAVNPVMQPFSTRVTGTDNFSRTNWNPNMFDRAKAYADGLSKLGEAIDNIKSHTKVHNMSNWFPDDLDTIYSRTYFAPFGDTISHGYQRIIMNGNDTFSVRKAFPKENIPKNLLPK